VRSTSVPTEVLDALINQVELLFTLSQQVRGGFTQRGVSDLDAQRMLGHIGIVGIVSRWFNQTFSLGFNESLLTDLCYYHDMAKALMGDPPRVEAGSPDKPWNVITSMISRFVKRGLSYSERRTEFEKAVQALSPYLSDDTPQIKQDALETLELYFLRQGIGKDVARFVFDLGQVIDVHAALWYADRGQMEASPYNVRSFTYQLSTRINHWTVRAYWRRMRAHRFTTIMLPAYGDKLRTVMAQ